MRVLTVKKWFHHIHMPNRHDAVLRIEHIVHDERFWPLVALLAFITLLILLVILAGTDSETISDRPFFPYGY